VSNCTPHLVFKPQRSFEPSTEHIMKVKTLLSGLVLVASSFSTAWAQTYPTKTISLIVPYPAGVLLTSLPAGCNLTHLPSWGRP